MHASFDVGMLCILMAHTRDACSALFLGVRGECEKIKHRQA